MDCYLLGKVPDLQSILAFHVLARLGREAVVIVSPADPFISLGCFETAEALDLAAVRERGWPIIRREVGGGTVYLDQNQIFYHLVLKADNPLAVRPVLDLYRMIAEPAQRAYRTVGIETRFKPVNDIVTAEGRKISGQGGGDIDGCLALVGGLLLDFDAESFCRVVKVPDEKFRDKLFQTVNDSVTSVKREIGFIPQRAILEAALKEGYEQMLGPLTVKTSLEPEILEGMDRLGRELTSEERLFKRGKKIKDKVKVAAGVFVQRKMHKAPGGLIKTEATLRDGRLESVELSGDFTILPRRRLGQLEEALAGVEAEQEAVVAAVRDFLAKHETQMPGVTPSDLARVLTEDR